MRHIEAECGAVCCDVNSRAPAVLMDVEKPTLSVNVCASIHRIPCCNRLDIIMLIGQSVSELVMLPVCL